MPQMDQPKPMGQTDRMAPADRQMLNDEQKQLQANARAQADAEAKIAALEDKLFQAEERNAQAGAQVADLQDQIAQTGAGAPSPIGGRGTITADHTGRVQG